MATSIEKTSTNYTVNFENENMRFEGGFSYIDRIDSMNVTAYNAEGQYIGNINYSENADGNTYINSSITNEYVWEAYTLLNTAITDIYSELKTDE